MRRPVGVMLLALVAALFVATDSVWACKFLDGLFSRCRVLPIALRAMLTTGPDFANLTIGQCLAGIRLHNHNARIQAGLAVGNQAQGLVRRRF